MKKAHSAPKGSSGASGKKKAAAKSRPAVSRPKPTPVVVPDEVRQQHNAGVLIRQEAAVAKDGELPPGATHEIVGYDEKGQPVLKRRRFNLV